MAKYWKIKSNSNAGYNTTVEIPLLTKDALPDNTKIETFARKGRKIAKEGNEGITVVTMNGDAYPIGIDDSKGLRRTIGYFQDDHQQYHGVVSGLYGIILLILALIITGIAAVSFLLPTNSPIIANDETVIVPPVIGMTVENAEHDIEAVGLKTKVNGPDEADAIVVSESPAAYTETSRGSTLTLVTKKKDNNNGTVINDNTNNVSSGNIKEQNTNQHKSNTSTNKNISKTDNTDNNASNETSSNKNANNDANTNSNTSKQQPNNENTEKTKTATITGTYDSGERLADGTAAVKINDTLTLKGLTDSYVTLDSGTQIPVIKEISNEKTLSDKVVPEYLEYNGSVYGDKWTNEFDMNDGWNNSYNVTLKKGETIQVRFAVIDDDNSFDETDSSQYAYLQLSLYDGDDNLIDASYMDTSNYDWEMELGDGTPITNSWSGHVQVTTDENNIIWNTMTLTANQDGEYRLSYGGYGLPNDTMIIEEPTIGDEKGYGAWNDGGTAQFDLGNDKYGSSYFNLSAGDQVTLHFAVLDTDNSFNSDEDGVYLELDQYDNTENWNWLGGQYSNTAYTWDWYDNDDNLIPNSWAGNVKTSTDENNLIWNEITLTAKQDGIYRVYYGAWGQSGDTIYMQAPITGGGIDYALNDGFTVEWPDITDAAGNTVNIAISYDNNGYTAAIDVPLHVHNYNHGIITWNDTDPITASATFTCDCGISSEIIECTIAEDLESKPGYVIYTATATSSTGTTITDQKAPELTGTLSKERLNKYMYNNDWKTESVTFIDTGAPSDVDRTDVSEEQNGTIWAWIDGTDIKVSNIKTGTRIRAPKDCSYLFYLLYGLKTINGLSNLDTSRTTNMAYMFNAAENIAGEFRSSLSQINELNTMDTSKVTNMEGMFQDCDSLTTLIISFNTSKVENMSQMFFGCETLSSLDITECDTSNVTNMSYMFGDCETMQSFDLSRLNTSNVANMSGMFYGCCALTSLDVSAFNTMSTTSMKNMFRLCKSLTSLNLRSFNTAQVTDMSSMFEDCTSMVSIDITSFNTREVKSMSAMFSWCLSLSSLDIHSFDTSNVTNMASMFHNCSALTLLDLSNFNTSRVTYMERMFADCSKIQSIDITSFDTSNVTDTDYMFLNCKELVSLDVSHFNTSAAIITRGMFQGCAALTVIDVSNFDTSNVENMNGMFYGCRKVKYLDVSGFNTSKATNMGGLFGDCSELTSINVSGFDTSNATTIASMFSGCSQLKNINIDGFNTSKVTDMSSLFRCCSSLTSLSLPYLDTSNVTNMNSMFYGCSSLTLLDITKFDTSKVTSMCFMFYECSSMVSLDLSSFNTSNVTNMEWMFNTDKKLQNVYVGSQWKTTKVTKSGSMFGYKGDSSTWASSLPFFNSNRLDKTLAYAGSGGYFKNKAASTIANSLNIKSNNNDVSIINTVTNIPSTTNIAVPDYAINDNVLINNGNTNDSTTISTENDTTNNHNATLNDTTQVPSE